jgi:hypothetical protein
VGVGIQSSPEWLFRGACLDEARCEALHGIGRRFRPKADNAWAVQAVRAVGHYGEMFERISAHTLTWACRGLNQLWSQGGILYAPPMR